jgi:hypothetical protein
VALALALDAVGPAEALIRRCLAFGAVLAMCGGAWFGLPLLSSRSRAAEAGDGLAPEPGLPVPRAKPGAGPGAVEVSRRAA